MPIPRPSPEITSTVKSIGLCTYGGVAMLPDGESKFYNHTVDTSVREYSGRRTPRFPLVFPLPFNPYRVSLLKVTPSIVETKNRTFYKPTAWQTGNRGYDQRVMWYQGLDTARIISHLGDAEAKCSSRLAGKFNQVSFNAGQFFAERQQFVNLVGNTARRIVHSARAVKRLRFREAANILGFEISPSKANRFRQRCIAAARNLPPPKRPDKYLATIWLEYQYGWKPLLQDVHGAGELLAKRFQSRPEINTVVASATVHEEAKFPYSAGDFGILPDVVEYRKSTTCKYVCTARVESQAAEALAITGISNPGLLAWELVPFSFVVDWFLPVGQYLEQMNAYNGFSIVEIRRTRFTKGALEMSYSKVSISDQPNWLNIYESGGSGSAFGMNYIRDSIAAPGSVPLEFKNPLSLTHSVNALALLRTTFGR